MHILLAIDGSEHSEWAIRFVTRLQLSSEDRVTVLHVIGDLPPDVKHIRSIVAPRILDTARTILKGIPAQTKTLLREGFPDVRIVETAKDTGADLIVMGARGLKPLTSVIYGSITRSVVIQAPVPVFVTHMPREQPGPQLKILYATDGSDCALEAGRLLSEMPFPDDSEVSVLHVIPSGIDIPQKFHRELDAMIRDTVEKMRAFELERSEKVLELSFESFRGRYPKAFAVTKFGDPPTEIIETAESLKSDVIVLGSRGVRGIKGILGSTSRNVFRHARCSVLIGRRRQV
jgi:nucleotide-binding universal stress UspA family protein